MMEDEIVITPCIWVFCQDRPVLDVHSLKHEVLQGMWVEGTYKLLKEALGNVMAGFCCCTKIWGSAGSPHLE